MAEDEKTDLRKQPMGPFAPPLPKEAENEEAEPMAVALDKTTDQDSFKPTSAPLDAFDEDVARKHRPKASIPENARAESEEETREMQSPPGYTKTDARGFRHPDADEIEEEY